MDFVFMLTRNDETVEDCLEVYERVRALDEEHGDLRIRHLGFKDVGVSIETLRTLHERITQDGRTSYMEVVSTTREDCLRSAKAAVEIGVDRLLGGVNAEEMLDLLSGSGIEYLPFPGRPEGHPTRLGGTPESVAGDCRRFDNLGCTGVDLLAYRATEADPLALVRAARAATDGILLVAGSIDSPERIRELAEAGADAFTIGSAVFDGSFSPRRGALTSRLRDVCAATAP